MCRSNRITENKSNCNIYLWCKEKKADLILNYIFENTDGFIKDKVFIYNTDKRIIEKHIIQKSINSTLNENIIIDKFKKIFIYNTITFENNKIIIISDNDNNLWFNAKQICVSLKYKQSAKAITKNVDKENKIQLKNMNINFKVQQQPDSIYINESGLYSLLLSSRTNKSKKFFKWIKNDVILLMKQCNIFSCDSDIIKSHLNINELKNKISSLLTNNKSIKNQETKFKNYDMINIYKNKLKEAYEFINILSLD